LGEQSREQMFALHLLLAALLRQLLGGDYGAPGFFGEKFGGGMHGSPPSGGGMPEPYGRSSALKERRTESGDTVLLQPVVRTDLNDRFSPPAISAGAAVVDDRQHAPAVTGDQQLGLLGWGLTGLLPSGSST